MVLGRESKDEIKTRILNISKVSAACEKNPLVLKIKPTKVFYKSVILVVSMLNINRV